MHSIGIDIGSSGIKGIMLDDKSIVLTLKHETLAPGSQTAQAVMETLLEKAGIMREDVTITVTGIAMDRIQFADRKKSALTCLARGARWHFENCRRIVDIGAETTTAINLTDKGKVINYVRNNKCAAGTAMLLKVMSEILQIPLSEMDHEKYRTEKKKKLSNVCSVFVESEAISYLSRGVPREEILAGTFSAIEDQLLSLLAQIDIIDDLVLTGGAANNNIISGNLSERIGHSVHVPEAPEMIAALGASLMGRDARKEAR